MNEEVFEFEGKVVNAFEENGKKFVELEKTYFYPDGKGGQLGDRGTIGNSIVLSVIEKDEKILHEVDTFPKEALVLCVIDKERRLEISREHSAQHILSKAFIDLYGIETVSFHMGETFSTIDLDKEEVKDAEIENAELLANKIVLEDRIVKKYFVKIDEAKDLDLRKAQEIKGDIRIVEVEGFDKTMCGGTHVNRTGEIGIIKVFKKEKIKKSYTRIYFASGIRALKIIQEKIANLNNIAKFLTTQDSEIFDKINKLIEENKNLSKSLKNVEEMFVEEFLKRAEAEPKVEYEFENISRKAFEKIAISLKKSGKTGYITLNSNNSILIALLLDKIPTLPSIKTYTIEGVIFFSVPKESKNDIQKLIKSL